MPRPHISHVSIILHGFSASNKNGSKEHHCIRIVLLDWQSLFGARYVIYPWDRLQFLSNAPKALAVRRIQATASFVSPYGRDELKHISLKGPFTVIMVLFSSVYESNTLDSITRIT